VDPAVAAYQKGLEYNPMNAKVHVSLGKIYYSEKGLYYESVTAYKKAIDLDPGYLDARMGLAEVYEDKGLYKEAIEEYRRVVDADAKNTGALYNLALVYEKVDPKEAVNLWERYIGLAGSQPSEKDWVDVARLHLKKLKQQGN
jgi:tetratricopeptide (TPR) repeat protein